MHWNWSSACGLVYHRYCILYCTVLYWVSPCGRVYHWYSRPEQSEPPLVEQVALTARRELGLMKSLPPSPTRHSSWSAHSGDNSCRIIVRSIQRIPPPTNFHDGRHGGDHLNRDGHTHVPRVLSEILRITKYEGTNEHHT